MDVDWRCLAVVDVYHGPIRWEQHAEKLYLRGLKLRHRCGLTRIAQTRLVSLRVCRAVASVPCLCLCASGVPTQIALCG